MWVLHQVKQRKRISQTSSSSQTSPQKGRTPEHVNQPGSSDTPETLANPNPNWGETQSLKETPWDFSEEDLGRFPALRKRNFWCIQRHQARALHYDLRMQLDGSTVSWAIPKGLLGISKNGESNRLAVETTLHPISYTVFEGSDGRMLPSGHRGGTLLWDIGYYEIGYADDIDSEDELPRKRRRVEDRESEDPLGKYEENKFREAYNKPGNSRKAKSIHFTLKGGKKMTNHSYILIHQPDSRLGSSYKAGGKEKKTWFVRLPRGVEGYPWGEGGEEGKEFGRSVKSGLTLRQVCRQKPAGMGLWQAELSTFKGWQDVDELQGVV
ncbi:DNA ligase D, 3'-phosphoesterase domain-containing protein [Tremella mesenterica]|uniref:DNA ligase D, 3'-phosphoesterase domain-containing protein n=1 Tax=Tremella mesenterica TaxID=5217 RepID=A0A4Q1BVI0_TREME|nr:DNA ligase D, 3'-phosphoesterase domain-containing protein [Tremella mesenterica]